MTANVPARPRAAVAQRGHLDLDPVQRLVVGEAIRVCNASTGVNPRSTIAVNSWSKSRMVAGLSRSARADRL
ncbi:hypothetical protein [Micromonospora sp. NBC_01412]|uniref:hypothetical protein n=1 Tax=Micromonospora sp. NBC_01412 TaxID=2903590 RepID=UPI00325362BC